MRIVQVQVKDVDIDKGQQKKGLITTTCAVARAVQRRFRDKKASWAYCSGTALGKDIQALSPKRVTKWVEAHDRLSRVRPFILRVRVLD